MHGSIQNEQVDVEPVSIEKAANQSVGIGRGDIRWARFDSRTMRRDLCCCPIETLLVTRHQHDIVAVDGSFARDGQTNAG